MPYDKLLYEMHLIMNGKEMCSDFLLRILQKQKCLYALSQGVGSTEKLASYLAVNEKIQNYMYTFCEEVFRELEKIPYAVVKGAVLSDRIYGKTYYRSSGDIDILVSPKHIDFVTQTLKKNGFIQGRIKEEIIERYKREELLYHKLYTHQLAPFIKSSRLSLCPFINIDVNFSVLWGESPWEIDMDEYLRHIESGFLFNVKIYRLAPVYDFIALCLHHYKDMNSIYLLSEKGFCLNEFFDIYYYLINVKIDLEELKKYCQILSCGSLYLFLHLLYE